MIGELTQGRGGLIVIIHRAAIRHRQEEHPIRLVIDFRIRGLNTNKANRPPKTTHGTFTTFRFV